MPQSPVNLSSKNEVSAKLVHIEGGNAYPLNARYWPANKAHSIVVLIHGVVSHSLWFTPIVDHLKRQGISCLAPDRRGAGLHSTARGDAPDAEALYADLDAILELARSTQLPVHVVGFCWGASYVANYLAARQPEFDSVGFLAPAWFQSEQLANAELRVGRSGQATETPVTPIEQFTRGPAFEEFIKPDELRLTRVSPRFNGVMQEFSKSVWMKVLKIKQPLLCVLAEDDEMVDNTATQKLFGAHKNTRSELHFVAGGHGVQFDAPQQAATILANWISRINDRG